MAKASIEPLCGILRVGGDGFKHYDPFHFACTVRYLSPATVELCGLRAESDGTPAMTHEDWRAILLEFENAGVRFITITRARNGKVEQKWFDTTTKRRTENPTRQDHEKVKN